MTLPKVLCIGAQKAGTSWLHENLKCNPGAWLPPFKELHFLDHRFLPGHRRWTKGHVARGLRKAIADAEAAGNTVQLAYLKTLTEPPLMTRNWYRRVFAPCPNELVGIDVTPEYASIPSEGVVYAKEILGPNLRLIYLIREPVERALSQMRMYIGRRKRVPASLSEWEQILTEPDLFDRGNYASHVPRWEAVFPKASFLYIPFGRIPRNPLGVLKEVETFCVLPHAEYPNATEAVYQGPAIDFPEQIVERLRDQQSEQVRFIEKRFGKEFLNECGGEHG
jgi:hypothetical protein